MYLTSPRLARPGTNIDERPTGDPSSRRRRSQLQAGHTFASTLQPCLVIGGLALGVTALTCAFLLRETK